MFCLISWDIWRIDILFHTVTANGAMCCVQSHVSDSETPWQPARLLCPWDFPVKNTGWSGLPFPSRGDILEPQIELASPALQADSLPLSHLGSPLFLMLICKTDRGRMKITRKHCSLNDNITTHHNLLWLNTWSIQQVNTSLNKILITKPWNRPTAIARPEYIEILLLLLSRFSRVRLCVTP